MIMHEKILVTPIGYIKDLGEGKIGGHCLLFTSEDDPDLAQDFFTKDTDFDLSERDYPIYYCHTLDPKIKDKKLGRGYISKDDLGLWITAQLDLRDEYEKAIYDMVRKGKMGWSTGSVSHLVRREQKSSANFIKSWPIAEISITPQPCEPRTYATPIKTLDQYRDELTEPTQLEPTPGLTLDAEFNQCLHSIKSLTERLQQVAALREATNRSLLSSSNVEKVDHLINALQSLKALETPSNEEVASLMDEYTEILNQWNI